MFELPAAIRFAMGDTPSPCRYEGFIALGCVIRGETDHYDHICREVSRALMDLSVAFSMPLGFGAHLPNLRTGTARAAVDQKNKGGMPPSPACG